MLSKLVLCFCCVTSAVINDAIKYIWHAENKSNLSTSTQDTSTLVMLKFALYAMVKNLGDYSLNARFGIVNSSVLSISKNPSSMQKVYPSLSEVKRHFAFFAFL